MIYKNTQGPVALYKTNASIDIREMLLERHKNIYHNNISNIHNHQETNGNNCGKGTSL